MKKYSYNLWLLFLLLQFSSPQNKQDTKYFYNDNTVFKVYDNCNDSLSPSHIIFYEIQGKTINRYIFDTILIGRTHKSYKFIHSTGDTIFFKPKSYLDKIDYYDAKWIKNEENLDSFWSSIRPWKGGRRDTLDIFVIEPVKNSDSLIFRQVHRWYITR